MGVFIYVQLKGSTSSEDFSKLNTLMESKGYTQKVKGATGHGENVVVTIPKQLFFSEDESVSAAILSASLTTLIHNAGFHGAMVLTMKAKEWGVSPPLSGT